jgi:hypothetical protein
MIGQPPIYLKWRSQTEFVIFLSYRLRNIWLRSPFPLVNGGLLGDGHWFCPHQMTPNLIIAFVRVGTELQ